MYTRTPVSIYLEHNDGDFENGNESALFRFALLRQNRRLFLTR